MSEGKVHLLFWEQGQVLRDWVEGENEHGEYERFTVYPDAFFGLEVQGKKKERPITSWKWIGAQCRY